MTSTMAHADNKEVDAESSKQNVGGCLRFLNWLTKKLRLVEDGATPPNWRYIGLVFLALFSSASTLTFLLPFLPEMMLTLGYSETNKGTYVGIVASSVFAGRIVGSVFWGWLSDRQGRKLVLLITIAFNGIFAALFGFASNLMMAVIFRFLCGAFNGTIGTAKTILYDISDNTNQALSMSMLSISFGMGMIIGPTVGGTIGTAKTILYDISDNTNQALSMSMLSISWGMGMIIGPTIGGTIGTAKTILYDISDNTNQALSMSMLSISWGMGMIIGPTIGGVLASPAVKWPEVFSTDSLFGQYPYLLPSLFPFVSCVCIFFVIFFKFDETFVVKSSKRTQHELTFTEVADSDTHGAGKESHHPLLGDMSRKSQSSLLQICQSMHSVHAEAESAAFLAMETANKSLPTHETETQSLPDVNTTTALLDDSQVSNSMLNINGKYEHGTNIQIIAENAAEDSNANSSNNLSYKEFETTESSIFDDVNNKQNQNNLNELGSKTVKSNISQGTDNSEPVDNNEMKETNQKTVHNVVEDQKNIDNRKYVIGVTTEEENERICMCVENLCSSGRLKKYSLFKLLRLSDVWATVIMYTVFSMITISIEDIFPVFASTRKDYGGLGFSTNEIGLALGAIFLPLLLLQIKIYPFLVSKMGIRKVFLFSAMVSLICCQLIPMVRLLNSGVWLWICLLGVQIPYKIATNCCFAGTSLLINNSVSQELAGQVNGLAMMTTAIGRTVAPVLAGLLFSWTVTYGEDIGPPLDTSFPFFIIGVLFFITVFECLHLNPRLDKQKK